MTAIDVTAEADSTHRDDRHFDHRDPGNPARAWSPLLDSLPEGRLPPPGTRVVVLAAHPDDETLGCGGILGRVADLGHPVTVIIATDGEASHPDSPTHRPERLATIRRREAAEAVAVLAPGADLVQLGLPDGLLAERAGALQAAVAAAVGDGPAWILATWEQDRHPDHAACARAARRAAMTVTGCVVAEFPIWAWHWGNPEGSDLPVTAMTRIPVAPQHVRRRRRALAAYRSQVRPLSDLPGDEAVVGPQVTAHFDRDFDVLVNPLGSAAGTEYFDMLFAESDDPWGIGARWYEQRKRALLLASLPRRRFGAAFEPGCAAGHLTVELADRCDTLVAADASLRAVRLTTAATAGRPGVTVRRMRIPEQWPRERFNLLVLSEIGYYVTDLELLSRRLLPSLRPGGVAVLCHWRHPAIEHPQTAEAVHDAVRRLSGLHPLATHVEEDFLLEVFGVDGTSVARAGGILG